MFCVISFPLYFGFVDFSEAFIDDSDVSTKKAFRADKCIGNTHLLARRPYAYYRQNSSKSQRFFQADPQHGVGSRV